MLLESSEISTAENDVKLREVVVHNVNRTDLHKSLICQASNNNINGPSTTTVHLDVYCKLSISFINLAFRYINFCLARNSAISSFVFRRSCRYLLRPASSIFNLLRSRNIK